MGWAVVLGCAGVVGWAGVVGCAGVVMGLPSVGSR